MTDTNPYDVLARIYDDAGFSTYSGTMASRLLTFIQQQDWIGRRVLDLGCGTGMSTAFFAGAGMEVIGVDSNRAMLQMGERRLDDTGYSYQFVEGDIREMNYPTEIDLVFCVGNVLNEVRSLREIEQIFARSFAALRPGKVMIFDMTTIRGLAEQLGKQDAVLDAADWLFITVENNFNYESIALNQRINFFLQQKTTWDRAITTLTLRGFPYNAVVKTAEKVGFQVRGIYDTRLQPFEPSRDMDGRFIVVAVKPE